MKEQIYKYRVTCDGCKNAATCETTEKDGNPEGWKEYSTSGYGGGYEISHYCSACWPAYLKGAVGW